MTDALMCQITVEKTTTTKHLLSNYSQWKHSRFRNFSSENKL